MNVVDKSFNFAAMVLWCHCQTWLECLGNEVNFGAWCILFVHQKVQLLLVVLEPANQVELLISIVTFKHHIELGLVCARIEISIELDRLDNEFLAQLRNILSDPCC